MAREDRVEHPRVGTNVRITHEQAKLLISKSWDGELAAAEEHQLSRHLRDCPDCRAGAERMKGFLAELDEVLKRQRP